MGIVPKASICGLVKGVGRVVNSGSVFLQLTAADAREVSGPRRDEDQA